MKRVILILAALVGCSKANSNNVTIGIPHAPPSIKLAGPTGNVVMAAGDTLLYTISGPAGAGSSSYDFVLSSSVTNGTWSVRYGLAANAFQLLPASGNTGAGGAWTITVALTAIPWDSSSFRYVMHGRNSRGISNDSLVLVWSIRRLPHAPPSGVVDSSKVIGLLVRPDTIRFTALNQKRQACPFILFADGKVAIAASSIYAPLCDTIYTRVFAAALRAISVPQRLCADSGGIYCTSTTGMMREWQGQFVVISHTGKSATGTAAFRPDSWPPAHMIVMR